MDERIVKFRVGVMVVATMLVVGILVVLFGELPSLHAANTQSSPGFRKATGVAEGTPVRKEGILIGRVDGREVVGPEAWSSHADR